MIVRHNFAPPTSSQHKRRLDHLCGALDENITLIADTYKVKIIHRFEQFKIDGLKAQAQAALQTLKTLYDMADEPILQDALILMLAGKRPTQPKRGEVTPRTDNQAAYFEAIAAHDLTFAVGPAGTGKTFLAVAYALDLLGRGEVQRIVLTRPAVEAGERLGFLPGDIAQKVDPYLRPLYDALYELWGADKVAKAFERNQLEIAPLAFMRGRTLNHAFVILDEAQNTSVEQMKMFLTRMGFGTRVVVTGDTSQIDLPKGVTSGLVDALNVLKRTEGVGFAQLDAGDVLRHPLVSKIVRAYAKS